MNRHPAHARRVARLWALIGSIWLAVTMGGTIAAADEPTRIAWAPASLRLIEPGAGYARMARGPDGRILCAYDRGGRLYLRASDDGATWSTPVLVAEDPHDVLTNAEILTTRGGLLLYFWNARPREASRGAEERRFTIRMTMSDDQGRTWSEPQTLHAGGTRFRDGCWEPAAIEQATGEIWVYFADESRFVRSNEQEIAVVKSLDGGRSWGRAERFAFRPGHRDGMPVPMQLVDGRIAVAIEDDGLSGGRFKPSILLGDSGDGRPGAIGGDDPRRRGALIGSIDPSWYAGAPYLRRFPGGTTILSFQEDRSGAMRDCRMVVCLGDATASGFEDASRPFPDEPGSNQLWNSLFVKDDRAVTAVTTATFRGVRGVWAVDGRLTTPDRQRPLGAR